MEFLSETSDRYCLLSLCLGYRQILAFLSVKPKLVANCNLLLEGPRYPQVKQTPTAFVIERKKGKNITILWHRMPYKSTDTCVSCTRYGLINVLEPHLLFPATPTVEKYNSMEDA